MKSINTPIILFLALSLLMPTITSAKGGNRGGTNVLSKDQTTTLLWMREEEKLARDVYLKLDDLWDRAIFKNISSAEQRHMNALLKKINSFGLTDPALSEEGKFTNETIQELYTNLVAQGSNSYADALIVGMTIEELDIADLIEAIKNTDNLALKTTYENLLEGSKNHLRAFMTQINKHGIAYDVQHLEPQLFNAILGLSLE